MSEEGAKRRARMLRIPDDEVSRPSSPDPLVESAPSARSAPTPPVVVPSTPPPAPEGVVVTPMRIITINPAPPAAPPADLAAVPSAPPAPKLPELPKLQEDSWTPFQPTVADGADGVAAADGATLDTSGSAIGIPADDVTRRQLSSDDIPIDDEPSDAHAADAAPESLETVDASDAEIAPPAPPRKAPPVAASVATPAPVHAPRAVAPTEPEGEEVSFEDDAPAPTPISPPVFDAPPVEGDRRSDPGAELDAADLVVEPAAAAPAAAPPKSIANLPPMRPRLDSKPPLPGPPPAKKPVPPPKPGKPPLVIVPPHVGTMAPQPAEGPGTKRKGRLWWEDLFNDDYLRACEKLTDEQIAREVDFVEDSLSIEKGGAVLDLACGTGRHAIELARRGYEVVGYDLSLAMLARAGDEAQDRNAKINFIQGDMRDMSFEEQFDGVYCWNTSFGYFEEEKNAAVIDNVHRALKSEGLLLLDVVNRDFLIRQTPSLAWFEGDGCVCMDEMNVDFITSRMKVKRTIMLDDGRTREIEYSVRVYSLHELGRILHEHGFKVCEVSGRIATPSVYFGNESPRTLILAEKR